MSGVNKTLWHMIQDAEEELLREGVEDTARERPHIFQMALTGFMVRAMNGNGPSKTRRAAQVGVPTVTGAGILAILLQILAAVS